MLTCRCSVVLLQEHLASIPGGSRCSPAGTLNVLVGSAARSLSRLKNHVKYNYPGSRTRDGILDFADRVSGSVTCYNYNHAVMSQ